MASDDRPQLAARGAREQVARAPSVEHPGALEAVEQVEADDRARVAQQRAASTPRWAACEAIPQTTIRPNGRQRAVGGVEDLAAGHVEDDVDRRPPLASSSRSVRPSAPESIATSAPSSQRERALRLARGGRDHAARAERTAELDRQRADAAGGRSARHALARLATARPAVR